MAQKYDLRQYRIVLEKTNGGKSPVFRKKGEEKPSDEFPGREMQFSFTSTNGSPETWEVHVDN